MSEYDLNDFLFDLRGYLILENAIDASLLAGLNAEFDKFPDLQFGEWHGNAQRLDNNGHAGLELQNIVEVGKPFETLIDHPSWIDRLHRYCGEEGTWVEGLYIDECFASIRRNGGYFPMHSGGQDGVIRNQYGFHNGRFRCAQVNILLALTDIGPGDGGTRILPGSHKSNIAHPVFSKPFEERAKADDEVVEGSIEVNMKAGDALMFVDALSHGATKRTNAGDRRVVIYRYGPMWGNTRYGYQYSPELLARLTPAQRKILQPITPRVPGNARGLDRHAAE
ncbi:phytanoyl-CoA dioxygenase family protein [Devosia rhodophyticola]|uniref:Phytanoyl-CoA dioxygenase family protein n=1 Tax=Devosia rhodophyticola TaxID=3026423 RepID=A0ABY7YWZ7_9HYPH|nr:phytanoyl-CoA dioxygenase family protein [Devosia rhodophyticola]WDR05545.1 phytanoyl-CoA dioxygenase family protein [Devosia rhodophyticola]